jgi:hypothetical protein
VNHPGVTHENTNIVAIPITVEVQSDPRIPGNVPQLGFVPFAEDQNCPTVPVKPDGPGLRGVVSIDGNKPDDLLLAKPTLNVPPESGAEVQHQELRSQSPHVKAL